jgi:CheY-like chemotaxis protein
MGIKVVLANNGLEAFNKYSINPENYDLIFMDIQMPTMDGIEATHEILDFEEEEEIPHTPIIALTANALKGDRERFLAEGMDEYLTKPIKNDALTAIIKQFTTEKRKKELLENSNSEETENTNDDNALDLELEIEVKPKNDKNVIIATKNLLNLNILDNYLEKFGYNSVHHIDSINELGKVLDTKKENMLFIDDDFVDNYDISEVAKNLKEKVPNNIKLKIITFSEKEDIDNIDVILNIVNKQTLAKIL